jgi:transketolase
VEIAALTAFLAPFLPTLVKAGEKAVEKAADAVSDEAFKYARALWEKLKPGVDAKPAAKEAAEEVAARPDDEDALAALRLQLRKLLEEDTRLAGDLAAIWQKAEAANVVQVTASGERSVAVGGDVTGSTIVTGDQAPSEG